MTVTERPGPGTTEAWAWCDACRCLQPFATLPPLQIRNGVTLREGTCAVCGGELYRVGGARNV